MNLTSCDKCGVVLDKDKLPFPDDIWTDDGIIDETKAIWHNRDYHAFVKCPVCGEAILQSA